MQGRRLANMIGAVFAVRIAFSDHRPQWCRSVRQVTEAAALDHRRGVPMQTVTELANKLPNPMAKRDALAAIYYAYVGNSDDKLSPAQLGELVYRVCLDPQGNL